MRIMYIYRLNIKKNNTRIIEFLHFIKINDPWRSFFHDEKNSTREKRKKKSGIRSQ